MSNPYDRELLDSFNELADANQALDADAKRVARAEARCDEVKRKHRAYVLRERAGS